MNEEMNMGWYGGTDIFDCVAESLLGLNISTPCHSTEGFLREVLDPLLDELEDKDWNTLSESKYWSHPVVGKILGNTFEEDSSYEEDWEEEDGEYSRDDEDWFFDERDE